MKWLWILVGVALVLSPLIGLRASPRQKRLAALRRLAASEGVGVRLSRRPDARDDERDLDSVGYRLPWGGAEPSGLQAWVLTHNSGRGLDSDWDGWRWFEGPAPHWLAPVLGDVITRLPGGTRGLVADRGGLVVHWDERGEEGDLIAMIAALKALRAAILAPSSGGTR